VRATFTTTIRRSRTCPARFFRSDTAFFAPLPWQPARESAAAHAERRCDLRGRRPLPYGEVSDQNLHHRRISNPVVVPLTNYGSPRRTCSTPSTGWGIRLRLGISTGQPQPTLVPEREFTAGAPRAYFSPSGITSEVRDAKKKSQPRGSLSARTGSFGCIGQTGGNAVDLRWPQPDPRARFQDCRVGARSENGLDLTLTQATLHIGGVPRPKPTGLGWAGHKLLSHGNLRSGPGDLALDVDLCRPSSAVFPPRPRHYRATGAGRPGVADPWGHHTVPDLVPRGGQETAIRDGNSYPFTAAIRLIEPQSRAVLSPGPIPYLQKRGSSRRFR